MIFHSITWQNVNLMAVIDSFHQLTSSSGFGFTASHAELGIQLKNYDRFSLERHFLIYEN